MEQGSYHGERRYIHRDGTVVYALYAASLVRDADGRPSVVFGQVQDITERKLAQAVVLRLNAKLERRMLREHARIEVMRVGAGVFAVCDDGVGFNMDFADMLFKPFARLHRKDEFPGLGVGLTTVVLVTRRLGPVGRGR